MHYYVITGGPLPNEAAGIIGDGEVIAADAGIDFCLTHGIKPSLAVGDFDSVSASGLEKIRQSGVPLKTYPVEKDMTDTEIALTLIPEDCEITVICPQSGRLDHTIANIQLAAKYHAQGRKITLDDGITRIQFISGNETIDIDLSRWGDESSVSLVPLETKVTGVSTEGLYYSLNNGTLEFGSTFSFSNKPGKGALKARISIVQGLLAVIVSKAI